MATTLAVGLSGGAVRTFDLTGATTGFWSPYPNYSGSVSVAVGDLDADGLPDLVTGTQSGGGAHVKAFSGSSGALTMSFLAYGGFSGGVNVAVGEINGDGAADIVTSAGAGGGPHIKVFDGVTGNVLRSFLAYSGGSAGGVSVATGDLGGDGKADIVTGAAAGGAAHVKVFDGATGAELRSFLAYSGGFSGGVNVAAGDVNGDGFADIVTGAGAGVPHVKVFDAVSSNELLSFLAFPGFAGGVHVASADINGDGFADIVTGIGAGGGPHVKVFDGRTGVQALSFLVTAQAADSIGSVAAWSPATPVPETAAFWLMSLGLGALGWHLRKR